VGSSTSKTPRRLGKLEINLSSRNKTFGYPSSGLEGIIVSIYNLGAFSGCILTFIFGEKFGRRLSMWVAMGWIIVGAILQSTSYSVPQIMIARYVTGIGTGIETSTVRNAKHKSRWKHR